MSKQNSIDWLIEQYFLNDIGSLSDFELKNASQKAKQMHQEEIENAFAAGVDDEYEYNINNEPRTNSQDYYNQTFNKNNQ